MQGYNSAAGGGFLRRSAQDHQSRAQQSTSARQMRWTSMVL
jgi:hypothetical protein